MKCGCNSYTVRKGRAYCYHHENDVTDELKQEYRTLLLEKIKTDLGIDIQYKDKKYCVDKNIINALIQ